MTSPVGTHQSADFSHHPNQLSLNEDGSLLAVALFGGDAPIVVLQTKDGKKVAEYGHGAKMGFGVAFAKKQLYFVTWDEKSAGTLWKCDGKGGKATALSNWKSGFRAHGLTSDPTGNLLAVTGSELNIWDLDTDTLLRRVPCSDPAKDLQVAFTSDGKHMWCYGTASSVVIKFSISDWKEHEEVQAPRNFGAQLALSADDRFLVAVGDGFRGVAVHDLEKGARLMQDTMEIFTFDEDFDARAFAFASGYLVTVIGQAYAMRLPDLEFTNPSDELHEGGDLAHHAAWARKSNLVAFGIHRAKSVVWFPVEAGE